MYSETTSPFLKLVFSFLAVSVLGFFFILFQLFIPPSFSERDQDIVIARGSNTKTIAAQLKKEGIIRSKTFFYIIAKLKGYDRELRAGTFTLSPSESLVSILIQLQTQSGVSNLVRITIPEGYDIRQIGQILEDKGLSTQAKFMDYINLKAQNIFQNKYPFLADAPAYNLEGFIYPDTYYFAKGETLYTICDTFFKQFEKVILPLWENASTSKGTPKQRFNFYEVLTMASIVQKEARHTDEMPKISSVFYNRLKKMMPLGADPTVVYGLGLTTKELVTYKDTRSTSPYNTYKVFGFPPTPIASPGKKAFIAAIKPLSTPYYFFVARKDGYHIFTKTYAEHLAVQRKK